MQLVRRAYKRLTEQDPLGDWTWFFEEFAHEALELHPQGTYLDSEQTYRGREGWVRFWGEFAEVWEWWHFEPESFEFIDAGERVLVLARSVGKGRESGVETIQEEAHIWTIRDCRMLSGTSYRDRERAVKDAGVGGYGSHV